MVLDGIVVNDTPLRVVSFGIMTAIIAEIVGYLMIYRTASFKRLKKEFEKYQPAKEKTEGEASNKAKKQTKKQDAFEAEAGKKMAVVQIVTGIITMATMIISMKVIPKIFGNDAVGVLPFEPPSFIKKITQRGLDAESVTSGREFSPFFIFMLCQGSVRVIVQKMLGWGPSRTMSLFKPNLEKAFKTA